MEGMCRNSVKFGLYAGFLTFSKKVKIIVGKGKMVLPSIFFISKKCDRKTSGKLKFVLVETLYK